MRYAIAVLAAVLLAGCSSGGGTPKAATATPRTTHATHAPRTVQVSGTLAIKGVNGVKLPRRMSDLTEGHSCSTAGGYSDIGPGTEVVISSDSGRTLAITQLGRGRYDASLQCSFPFSATVPTGLGFYGVEVSHRGVVKEPERGLSDVQLTLGSN